MDDNITDLQKWRERLGIPQRRLAKLANLSLTTLRNLESGTHKPQGRTVTRLIDIMRAVESGKMPTEQLFPIRKRRGSNPNDAHKVVAETPPPAVEIKPVLTPTSGPLLLSNLDLELINRVLNMNGPQKVSLLEKLIQAEN